MIIDKATGEIMKGRFMKIFFDDIGKLFGLSKIGYETLFLMVKSISLGNRNSIVMTMKRRKEYASKIDCTVRQINNQLKVMEEKGIAKRLMPEDIPNEWTINPELVFSGNEYQQVKMILTYTDDGRKLEVRAGKENDN